MGKAEVGTPKYIANKIKAKGLQKLRWYCQMCEKQCRDENGFKCHMMSESHQRQLLLFADSPRKFLSEFSRNFVSDFLNLLRFSFGTKRVLANKVYQTYIADRKHIHMNSTQWETLTDFVKWLGQEGKCVVDETEKGWFITYIDRDPEVIRQQEALAKKKKMEKDDEEDTMDFIEKQIARGKNSAAPESQPTELLKSENEKVTLTLKPTCSKQTLKTLPSKPEIFQNPKAKSDKNFKKKSEKRPVSALEAIIMEEQEEKMRKMKYRRYSHSSRD